MGATVAAGKPLRNGAAAADGSSRLSPLRTIRARLYLAFGFAASMTVAAKNKIRAGIDLRTEILLGNQAVD